MSDKDREIPTLTMAPDEDDIASFQRKRSQGMMSERIGDVPPVKHGSGGGGFMTGLLFLLVLGLGAGGYYLYQQLELAKAQIALDQERIVRMEKQLLITDESLDESATAIEKKIHFLDTEVRKLWDNVWKKHKAELAGHDQRLAALEKSLKASQGELSQTRQQLQSDREQLSALKQQLAKAQSATTANSKRIDELRKNGQLAAEVARLEQRVAANEEWLASVNAFRRQINGDITALRESISRHHSAPAGP